MPQQKTFTADQTNPEQVSGLFDLAKDLVLDGWGASVRANPDQAIMTTNAPMAIINFHARKQLV